MNIYIILIIIIISLRFILLGLPHFMFQESFKAFCTRYSNFALIVIPLLSLYFKNLFGDKKTSKKTEILHFIFPLIFLILLINIDFLKVYYRDLNYLLFAIFFLYLMFYSFICYKVLKQNIWSKKHTIKVVKTQGIVNSKWTYFLFLGLMIMAFRLLVSIFLKLSFGGSSEVYSFQWTAALIWLIILFKIIASPEILYGYDALYKKINENRNENLVLNTIWNMNLKIQINNIQHLHLKEKIEPNILNYMEKIEKISIKDQVFRNPKITLTELANKLNIPTSHLSYIFKYHSTISFSEYKKAIRIQDAITLINENYLAENTLDYLSKKVGFPSYNTFFTSFKEITGVAPFEFGKSDKK